MGRLRDNFTKSKKEITKNLDKRMLNTLNLEAPEGFEYKQMDGSKGLYSLRPKNGHDLNFKLKRIKLPKEIQGLKVTAENILDVLYVTQTKVDINDTEIIIDGKNYGKPSNILIKNLVNPESSRQSLVVPPFPVIPEPLKVRIGNEVINIKLKRVPYPSLTDIKIINDNYKFIKLSMILSPDGERDKLSGTFSVDLTELKTIKEVLKNRNILEGIEKKDVELIDFEVQDKKASIEGTDTLAPLLNFYKKVDEIGDIFKVDFLNETTFSHKIARQIKQLYISLIQDSFYNMDLNMNATHTFQGTEVPKEIQESLNSKKPMMSWTTSENSIILFGKEIQYYTVSIYDQIQITEILGNKKDGYKVNFIFLDEGRALQKNVMEEPEELLDFFDEENNIKVVDIDSLDW